MVAFLENGYLQDGLKALVYFVPLVYLILTRRRMKFKYFWGMLAGLTLLFLGHVLDFSDELKNLKDLFIIGKKYYLHDFYEDTIGFTLGFAVFILSIFFELRSQKR